jgi:PAS domain-containing protein
MKDGTPLSVMVASQPMHFEGHEVRLATVTDITDRLKAENDFRASEARLLALLGCARGIAFEFDADCRYVNLWTGDYSLMAAPRDQVIGRTVTEILGPEIGLAFSERVQLVLRGGDPESFEYQLDLPDGSRRWFSGDVHATPVVEGVQPTVVFFARDVTERKTAEAALERSESSFRMLIDQLPDGVLVHREGRILYANNSFSRMTGYAIPELVGHQLDAFTPPEEMGRISERLATLTSRSRSRGRRRS